jgi:hypothetical protein
MATPYCTGPALIYVRPPALSGPAFFGTTERTPRIQIRPAWSPVYNDLGGSKVPFDMMYEGEESLESGTFTRWNELIHATLANRPSTLGSRGRNVAGDIGTYMIAEGMAYTLWMVFPYASKALFAANNMPPGYRFPFSWLEGPDDLDENGTNPRKIGLLWHSLRGFDPSTGSFLLYDHDMSAVAGLGIN